MFVPIEEAAIYLDAIHRAKLEATAVNKARPDTIAELKQKVAIMKQRELSAKKTPSSNDVGLGTEGIE